MTKTIPIISGSDKDKAHVDAIGDCLGKDFELDWRAASAHKEPRKVDEAIRAWNEQLTPLITVAGRSDALSGYCAYRSYNPVVASRPDWGVGANHLEAFFFSTVGMPSRVPVGGLLSPERTAGYVRRLANMQKVTSNDATVLALLGDDLNPQYAESFQKGITQLGLAVTSRRCALDEVGDPSMRACVLFAYMDDDRQIDSLIKTTDKPIILCPPQGTFGILYARTCQAFDRGYRPEAAFVLDASLAGEYAAATLGLADPAVRKAVIDSKPWVQKSPV